jgi:hypothetical protein
LSPEEESNISVEKVVQGGSTACRAGDIYYNKKDGKHYRKKQVKRIVKVRK